MALPTSAVEWHVVLLAHAAALLLLGAWRQLLQTQHMPLLQSNDGKDRRTDTRPLHRPCGAYYVGSISNLQRLQITVHYNAVSLNRSNIHTTVH